MKGQNNAGNCVCVYLYSARARAKKRINNQIQLYQDLTKPILKRVLSFNVLLYLRWFREPLMKKRRIVSQQIN